MKRTSVERAAEAVRGRDEDIGGDCVIEQMPAWSEVAQPVE